MLAWKGRSIGRHLTLRQELIRLVPVFLLVSSAAFAAPARKSQAKAAKTGPASKAATSGLARITVTPATLFPGETLKIGLPGAMQLAAVTVGGRAVPVTNTVRLASSAELTVTVPRDMAPGKQRVLVGRVRQAAAYVTVKAGQPHEVFIEEQLGDGAALCAGGSLRLRFSPPMVAGLSPTVVLVPEDTPKVRISCVVKPLPSKTPDSFEARPLWLPPLEKPGTFSAVVTAGATTVKRRVQVYPYPVQPTITGVTPAEVFIDRTQPDVHPAMVTVAGTGFAAPPEKIELLLDGRSVGMARQVDPDGHSFTAMLDPRTKGGTFPVSVRIWGVGALPPAGPVSLAVVPGSDWRLPSNERGWGDWRALGLSLLVSFLLILFVLTVWLDYLRKQSPSHRRQYGLLWACLLEPTNQTLSLSRFQFLWWLCCFVFAYTFLGLGHFFIDARPELPSFSDSLYAFAISLGTLVAAQLTNSTRGVKGAGAIHPSWSDLVVSGGVVALDRVQQLIWTVLGGLGFVAITLQMYYRSMVLPDIPEKLIALMGLSSLGYLGGKLARKPGPVIQKVIWDPARSVLRIEGMQLSPKATVVIGKATYRPAQEQILVPADQGVSAEGYVNALEILNPPGELQPLNDEIRKATVDGKLALHVEVTNPQGEFAAWDLAEIVPSSTTEAPPPVSGNDANGEAQTPSPVVAGAPGALAIITTELTPGAINQPYQETLRASGGKLPYRWSGLALPDGLALDEAGNLTGAPLSGGDQTVSAMVTDADENQAAADLPLRVSGV